jgi:hypothetical protein
MDAVTFQTFLKSHNACAPGYNFAAGKSLLTFWESCERPDWMLWVLHHLRNTAGYPNVSQIVGICKTAFLGLNASCSQIFIAHLKDYEQNSESTMPMSFDPDLLDDGTFGGFAIAAGVLRSELRVV